VDGRKIATATDDYPYLRGEMMDLKIYLKGRPKGEQRLMISMLAQQEEIERLRTELSSCRIALTEERFKLEASKESWYEG
jgi:hypothetical protein